MNGDQTITVIEPPSGWLNINVRELWEHRELVYFLVWREIKVRYKQTALGAAWAIMQPLFTMLIFSLFFGRLAKMPSDGAPYPVFVLVALVPWTFFSNGMSQAANSLVNSANLVGKIYFPRLAVPIGSVLAALVDFGVAFSLVGIALVALPRSADVEPAESSRVRAVSTRAGPGCRVLAGSPECRVPRYPLYRSLYDPVVDVCDADRLPEQPPFR